MDIDQSKKQGHFVISLDFELFWGMFDKVTLETYGQNILGERTAIPRMLELFSEYEIHATWAGVGMLMTRSKQELLSLLPPPHLRPQYEDMRVSAYHHIEHSGVVGNDENDDPYHFGPSLVKAIIETPYQEFANHTFSHYYCADETSGNTTNFARDLEAHRAITQTYNIKSESIIFPRNQMDEVSLRTCYAYGIRAYRGNENHILYKSRKDSAQTKLIRAFRLLDHYINISGHHTYELPETKEGLPLNIPASRFFRPWNSTLRFFEWLRLRRIKNSMTYAARHGEVFHLWWHPHNVSINQEQNFKNLISILDHFKLLQENYGIQSASMKDITELVTSK